MPSTSSISSHVTYYPENSPNHLQKAGVYLKNLKLRGELRTCDMVFVLKGGEREHLHSVLAGGHSSKLARLLNKSEHLPLVLDMTCYDPYSVRKLVDWMYTGSVSYRLRHLADLLVLTHDMGVVFLHRQLEQTLRQQAQMGHLVSTLNIATLPSTGIDLETVNQMIHRVLVGQKTDEKLSLEEIQKLTLHSVAALAANRLGIDDQKYLINVALVWLRCNPNDIEFVIDRINVPSMIESDLRAFKKTLIYNMRNPYVSHSCYVWIKPGGNFMSIGSRCKETRSNSISQTDESQSSVNGKRSFTRSEMQDIEKIPDVFVDEDEFTKWERKEVDYSPSDITRIRALTDPFKSKKMRSFTHSEMEDIRRLPDQFVPNCTDCSITGSSTSTASLPSERTLTEACQMQMTTIGKHDRHDEAQQIHDIKDVSFSEKPKQVNSTYANIPKAATSSFYAC